MIYRLIHRIRETLRTLILIIVARLMGYNGAEFVNGIEGVHPRAEVVTEARK